MHVDSTYADETALLIRAVGNTRDVFFERKGHGPLAPYDHIQTRKSVPFAWAAYHSMLNDFVRELANEINAFGYRIGQLEAWSVVLPDYSDEDQMFFLMELVDALAESAVSAPYALRSRFIYSASHLSHQANCITRRDWNESQLPEDSGINYKSMLAAGLGWEAFAPFRTELDSLFDEQYNAATGHFRHKYQHRMPPRFVQGQTQTVTRHLHKDSRTASYDFGYADPLSLTDLVPILRAKHILALSTFERLSDLVRQHLAAIYRHEA